MEFKAHTSTYHLSDSAVTFYQTAFALRILHLPVLSQMSHVMQLGKCFSFWSVIACCSEEATASAICGNWAFCFVSRKKESMGNGSVQLSLTEAVTFSQYAQLQDLLELK